MDNLDIRGKAVELTIDDDPNRVIRFYPTDVEFAEAYFSLCAEFEAARKDIAAREDELEKSSLDEIEKAAKRTELTKEAFAVLRSGIDKTFGEGTSQTVFGDRNNLSMAARFLWGVTPYVRRARQEEIKRYTKNESAQAVME